MPSCTVSTLCSKMMKNLSMGSITTSCAIFPGFLGVVSQILEGDQASHLTLPRHARHNVLEPPFQAELFTGVILQF